MRRFQRAEHDAASIRGLLEERGASPAEAEEIVVTLAGCLSPEQMHVWLAHPEQSHPIPDESTNATLGMTLHWTAVNAIATGNTGLVIAEAHRFAGELDPARRA
jgi:hypothetical protein